jgi:hypothetical protein
VREELKSHKENRSTVSLESLEWDKPPRRRQEKWVQMTVIKKLTEKHSERQVECA